MFSTQQTRTYLILAILVLVTEILIALLVPSTSFIRHSLGDFLVVILIYVSIKSLFIIDAKKLAIATCVFAFFIEYLQYIHLLDSLGIGNKVVRIILGTSFSYADLLMYFLGSIAAYSIDVLVMPLITKSQIRIKDSK